MINPSHLRLGNIVMNISENCHHPVKLWKVTSISKTRVVCQSGNEQKVFKPINLQGVPLDRHHLIEMGFTPDELFRGVIGIEVKEDTGPGFYNYKLAEPGRLSICPDKYAWIFQQGGFILYKAFEFVHELQNHFASLSTQKKLTIKID